MKEPPILFSGGMVKAIIDGRKTQTRRVLKPQPAKINGYGSLWFEPAFKELVYDNNPGQPALMARCPYGIAGSNLWAKETFSYITRAENEKWDKRRDDGVPVSMLYRADSMWDGMEQDGGFPFNWTPSIFMPRWASRITLEICSVRVERIQDISDKGASNDCTAEGVFHCGMEIPSYEEWSAAGFHSSEKFMYRNLWDSINSKRGNGWDTNPWVWVIEFRRV